MSNMIDKIKIKTKNKSAIWGIKSRQRISVIGNNHKLTSGFDWFDRVNYVKRVDYADEIVSALQQLQALTLYISPRWNDLHFDPMADEVKQFLVNYGSENHA